MCPGEISSQTLPSTSLEPTLPRSGPHATHTRTRARVRTPPPARALSPYLRPCALRSPHHDPHKQNTIRHPCTRTSTLNQCHPPPPTQEHAALVQRWSGEGYAGEADLFECRAVLHLMAINRPTQVWCGVVRCGVLWCFFLEFLLFWCGVHSVIILSPNGLTDGPTDRH